MALRFNGENTDMKILKGACSGCDGSAVIGRILLSDDAERLCHKEAVIAVADGDTPFLRRGGTVGIIRLSPCSAEADDACARIILPYLPVGCIGKIALLDTAAGALFVSPDISTVNKYLASSTLSAKKDTAYRLYSTAYGRINIFPYFTADRDTSTETGCLWEPSSKSLDEDELFEKYRDAAEASPSRAITVISKSKAGRADEIRAAMRSGVYGNISLLFGGIISECELTRALDILCHTFCELELEGREFNGYIPRGLLIDTPYMLLIAKDLRGMDFFVYDLPSIFSLAVSGTEELPEEPLTFLCELISNTASARKDCGHRAITGGSILTPRCCEILLSGGITDFYTFPDEIPALFNTIEKATK